MELMRALTRSISSSVYAQRSNVSVSPSSSSIASTTSPCEYYLSASCMARMSVNASVNTMILIDSYGVPSGAG